MQIDVSLESSTICVVDGAGKILRETKVASEPEALIAWFRSSGLALERIGLEQVLCRMAVRGSAEAGFAVELLGATRPRAFIVPVVGRRPAVAPGGSAGSGRCLRRRRGRGGSAARSCVELRDSAACAAAPAWPGSATTGTFADVPSWWPVSQLTGGRRYSARRLRRESVWTAHASSPAAPAGQAVMTTPSVGPIVALT